MRLSRKAKNRSRQRLRPSTDTPTPKTVAFQPSRRASPEDESAPQKPKRSGGSKSTGNFWLQRIGLIVLLFAVIASLSNALTLSPSAEIRTVGNENSSSFLHDQATYQAAANKLLAGSFWNHNKVTIDADKLNKQLTNQFPELSSVSATLPLLAHRPIIYIQAAQPVVVLNASNGSYVLGSNGKALLRADTATKLDTTKLPTLQDQSGLEVRLDHQALTTNDVRFIQTVIAQLAAKQMTVESLTLPPAARELDVKLAGQPYVVKLNLQNDTARQQAGTFLATQGELKKKNTTPTQYVDVRVPGRAYYK